MWNHLLSLRGLNSKKEDVPSGRYYKVVVWIAAHASLDIFSLIVFSVARIGPVGDREQMLLEYLTTPVVAYHVGCYPIVYCGVRDLKFHEKVKEYRANPVPLRKARSSGSKSPNGTPPDASVIPRSPKSLEDQLLEPLPFITSNSSPTRRRSLEVEKRVSMVTPRRLNSMRRNPIPYNHLKLESAGTINRGTSVISGFRDIVQHSRQHALPVVGVLGNESRPRSAATTPKQTTVIN